MTKLEDEHPNDVARSIAQVAWGMEQRRIDPKSTAIGNEVYVEAIKVFKSLLARHHREISNLKERLSADLTKPLVLKNRDDYVPRIVEAGSWTFAAFVVELQRCAECDALMVAVRDSRGLLAFRSAYAPIDFEEQRKRAKISLVGAKRPDGEKICEKCSKTKAFKFECSLCEKKLPIEEIQQEFGWDGEVSRFRLCKPCYAKVPAKVWDEKVSKLEDETRYDNE